VRAAERCEGNGNGSVRYGVADLTMNADLTMIADANLCVLRVGILRALGSGLAANLRWKWGPDFGAT
jgi:hypothetical protein